MANVLAHSPFAVKSGGSKMIAQDIGEVTYDLTKTAYRVIEGSNDHILTTSTDYTWFEMMEFDFKPNIAIVCGCSLSNSEPQKHLLTGYISMYTEYTECAKGDSDWARGTIAYETSSGGTNVPVMLEGNKLFFGIKWTYSVQPEEASIAKFTFRKGTILLVA